MNEKVKIVELDDVVVKFAGDSGDGMQLIGTQFSDISAAAGNDLNTFPDYPSEIRGPQGTMAGVSGFTVHIGHKEVKTPGDLADVLIALNPAALRVNMKWIKPGAIIIIDLDNFDRKHYDKAGYSSDPLNDHSLDGYQIIRAPITALTREAVKDMGLDNKTADRSRNQFASGILYWLLDRDLEIGGKFLAKKFKGKTEIIEINKKVLYAGYNYAKTSDSIETTYKILPIENKKGRFRNITGNVAAAWGLLAASERSGLLLFLASYPITPASEILHEISARKHLGAVSYQAEDEIAGVCSAIGASFTGKLAATSTSGPGLALKGEAIGLAVMLELPLVIINVQRGGPSTGLPTKPEQSDLMQALYGRNGEAPCFVMASPSAAACYEYTYMAAKISLEHMTPVIILTDGYLAQGSELLEVRKVSELPDINPPFVKPNDKNYKPYLRDPEKLTRFWAVPGTEGLRHRIGSLEKEDITGVVSHDPLNHQKMTKLRDEKVRRMVSVVPDLEVIGEGSGEVLAVGWGGSYGAMLMAVKKLQEQGKSVSMVNFTYIKPLPKNTGDVFKRFKKILVCELNLGQFAKYLRTELQEFKYLQFNKIQGLPFNVSEIRDSIIKVLEDK